MTPMAEPKGDGNRPEAPSTRQTGGPGRSGQPVDTAGDPAASAAACLLYLCREESLRTSREEILSDLAKESPPRHQSRGALRRTRRSVPPDQDHGSRGLAPLAWTGAGAAPGRTFRASGGCGRRQRLLDRIPHRQHPRHSALDLYERVCRRRGCGPGETVGLRRLRLHAPVHCRARVQQQGRLAAPPPSTSSS